MEVTSRPAHQPSSDSQSYGSTSHSSSTKSEEDDGDETHAAACFRDLAPHPQLTHIPPHSANLSIPTCRAPSVDSTATPELCTSLLPAQSSNHSSPDSSRSTEFESCCSRSFASESAVSSSPPGELPPPNPPSSISSHRSSSPELHNLSYLQVSSSVSASLQSLIPHNYPTQRTSPLRLGGTASAPDLASLVRSARGRAQLPQPLIDSTTSTDPADLTTTHSSSAHSIAILDSTNDDEDICKTSLQPKQHIVYPSTSSVQTQRLNHAFKHALFPPPDAQPDLEPSLSSTLEGASLPLKLHPASSLAARVDTSSLTDSESSLDLMRDGVDIGSRRMTLSEMLMREGRHAPDASHALLGGYDSENELEQKALSSCLPRVKETSRSASVRQLVNSKKSKSRSKSQSASVRRHLLARSPAWTDQLSLPSLVPTSSQCTTPPVKTRVRTLPFHGSLPINLITKSQHDPPLPIPPDNMRKKSGFFRRKLCPQPDSSLDNLPASAHPTDVVLSQDPPEGRHSRDPSSHQPHRRKDTTPPVPTIPPSYQESDVPSPNASCHSNPKLPLQSQLTQTSTCNSSINHHSDTSLRHSSSSAAAEKKSDAEAAPESTSSAAPISPQFSRLHPTSYEEHYPPNPPSTSDQSTRSSLLESFLQPTVLRSPNLATWEQPPMPPPSSYSILSSLQTASRATASNGERTDPLCSRAPQPHPTGALHGLARSLSPFSTGTESLNLKTHKPSNKSSSVASAPFLSSNHSLTLPGFDQQRAAPISSFFPESTPSSCRPSIISTSELSEEDKLRLSLEPWKLDQDGVLQGGLSSPASAQTPISCQSSLPFSPSTRSVNLEQVGHASDSSRCHEIVSISLKSLSSFVSAASDLSDSNLHAPIQDHVNVGPDRAFLKPTLTTQNIAKHPLSDSSAAPSSPRLPSLVNPNRAAMQSRPSPGEPASRPSTYHTPIKTLDVDSPRPMLSSGSVSFPPLVSPSSDTTLTRGSLSPNSSYDSSHYLSISTAVQSPQPLSRSNSLKEPRGPSLDCEPSTPVKSRRRRHTHDDDAFIPDLTESDSPVEPSQAHHNILKSSQPSTKTTRHPSGVTLLKDTPPANDDRESIDHASLSPSIRLVSPSAESAQSQQETSSLVTCTQNSSSLSAFSSPKLTQSTPSTPPASQKTHLELGDSTSSSNTASSIAKIDRGPTPATGRLKRSGGGLGKQPINRANSPSATPQIPQLERRHLDKALPAKHPFRPEDSRSPRSHQSSPNLRNLRSPPPPDSFFSVVVSQPTQQTENCPSFSPNESENLNLTSVSASRQSSTSSVISNPSLIIPGMTVEANALRLAEMFWQEDETVIKQQKLTEWLGSPESNANQLQVLTRKAFLNKFDFKDLRIDLAFRKLCSKIYLKGETQQVDRILAEFSRRYWEQNQSNIYVNPDMVHALSYSILLLNTDLHVVDTVSRMSRSQFIRNTMETIGVQLSDLEFSEANRPPSSKECPRPSLDMSEAVRNTLKSSISGSIVYRPRRASIIDMARTPLSSVTSTLAPARPSMDRWRDALWSGSQQPTQSSRPSQSFTVSSDEEIHTECSIHSPPSETSAPTNTVDHHSSYDAIVSSPPASEMPDEGSRLSYLSLNDNTPSAAKTEKFSKVQFEKEVENLLKDIYAAIKTQPIAQTLAESHLQSVGHYGSLKRIASRRSQNSYANTERNISNKRASLRGFSGFSAMLSAGADGPGSRSNSPTPSNNMSFSSGIMGYSNNNAGSSVNLTSFNTPSIGFVSSLSQSIIREQNEEESLEFNQANDDQTCDSDLALLGAPWAKEGILQRKQYWESKGKRHKDRTWAEVFVVIQAGTLQMFQFGQNVGNKRVGGSETTKLNPESGDKPAVGGGNWLPNAQLVGEISLSHALTSVLVSGYSKDRAHVFVLTLSSGASYFFQTGTEELVHEWVSTCNYWAARLSKEPLTGGVSNMEYGWNQLLEMDLMASSEKKEELQDCQQDQEEMMSIGSGHSEHSHKARSRLRDRLFNGLPLGPTILSNQVTHSSPRVGEIHNSWSTSGSSLNSSSPLGSNTSSRINLEHRPTLTSSSPTVVSDKLFINDWNPPLPPVSLSSLSESAQLENLKKHTSHIQLELEKHNLLRKSMLSLYWNRPAHLQKAMANWEKKAQYLMAEIIKYTTYLNALELTIQVKRNLKSPSLAS